MLLSKDEIREAANEVKKAEQADASYRVIMSLDMILLGYTNKTIELETGIGRRKLSSQRRALNKKGIINESERGPIRRPSAITKNEHDYVIVSNIMLMYVSLVRDKVHDKVCVYSLAEAYESARMAFLESNPDSEKSDFLSISDAYSMAVAMRDKDTFFQQCPECRAASIVVLDKSDYDRCAFCNSTNVEPGKIFYHF